jgi:3-hydroxybutyryl-CoA dehydrogenase/5-formyl-3-hydroxy-2-methylpyridine 4-carboxylate dehydrogenase
MALLDMAGLDIYQAVGSYLNKELCSRGDVAKFVTDRTGQGKLGIKSRGGIFDYTPERIAELQPNGRGSLLLAQGCRIIGGRGGTQRRRDRERGRRSFAPGKKTAQGAENSITERSR